MSSWPPRASCRHGSAPALSSQPTFRSSARHSAGPWRPARPVCRGAPVAATPAGAVLDGSGLLAPGIPAAELFPVQAWSACVAHACRHPGRARHPDPQGLPALRAGIAEHLAATRGLLAGPACILVTAGTQQALRIAAEILLDPGDAVWLENPGYIAGRGAMLAAAAAPVPVPSDGSRLGVAPLGVYFSDILGLHGIVMGFASTPVPLAGEAARRFSHCIASNPEQL